MFSLEGDENNGENSEEEGVKDISNDLNNNHNDFDNNNNDEFSFLDTSQEKGEEEEEKETKCDKALKEAEVEDWTLEELGTYLLTFTPTEEETVWFKMATKNIPCETDSDVMPFFKAMIMKRLH